SIKVLLWLSWRQVRVEVLVLGGCGFLLGTLLGERLLFLWPFLTLALGVLSGTAVWSCEQRDGTRHFLADQRLSPARVWSFKTLSGILTVVLLAGLLYLGSMLRVIAEEIHDPQEAEALRHSRSFIVEEF